MSKACGGVQEVEAIKQDCSSLAIKSEQVSNCCTVVDAALNVASVMW